MWPELMALALSFARSQMSADETVPDMFDEAGDGADEETSDHAPSAGSIAIAVVNAVPAVPAGGIARCVHCRDTTCCNCPASNRQVLLVA